jgi:hypothetical protein
MSERQQAYLSVAVGGATGRFTDQLGRRLLPQFNRIKHCRGEGLPSDSDVEPTRRVQRRPGDGPWINGSRTRLSPPVLRRKSMIIRSTWF